MGSDSIFDKARSLKLLLCFIEKHWKSYRFLKIFWFFSHMHYNGLNVCIFDSSQADRKEYYD